MSGVIVRVWRGPLVESLHRGHLVLAGTDGVRKRAGDGGLWTYFRSAAKPLQALAVLEAGARELFGLGPKEIAIMAASHSGEAVHRETVRGLLARLDLGEKDLRTGTHEPFSPTERERLRRKGLAPGPLHSNCSGKHAGMLALAKLLGAPTGDYLSPEHPVQLRMRSVVAEMAGMKPEELRVGVDGCGVPVFGLPLERMAVAYAHLVSPGRLSGPRRQAAELVTAAMTAEPYLVAGEHRLDTAIMEAAGGRLVAKAGAEGIQAVANRETGEGMVLKIEDGGDRALPPAILTALAETGWLRPGELTSLVSFHRPAVRNNHGAEVGHLEAEIQWAD